MKEEGEDGGSERKMKAEGAVEEYIQIFSSGTSQFSSGNNEISAG